MISKILSNISIAHLSNEEMQRAYGHYKDLMELPGWKTHQSYLVEIGNQISLYMLSKEFTQLNAVEKDVQQRAFFIIKEVLEFLLNPLKVANKLSAIKQLNKEEATRRQPRRKPE